MNDKLLKLVELDKLPWESFLKMLTDFNTAMAKCQKELKPVDKDSDNGRFKSAKYETIREETVPILGDNGISIIQHHFKRDGELFLWSKISHSGGYSEEYESPVVVSSTNPGKLSDEQLVGSAITYCKRYVYCTIFGIATYEKDPDENRPEGTQSTDDKPNDNRLNDNRLNDLPPCSECGKPLRKASGKYGPFIGCTGYPDCAYIKKL